MGAQTCALPTYHASNQHRVQENIDSIVTWPSAIGRDCRTAAGNNVLHAEAAPRASWQSAPPNQPAILKTKKKGITISKGSIYASLKYIAYPPTLFSGLLVP